MTLVHMMFPAYMKTPALLDMTFRVCTRILAGMKFLVHYILARFLLVSRK